jgi:hypothetical protein
MANIALALRRAVFKKNCRGGISAKKSGEAGRITAAKASYTSANMLGTRRNTHRRSTWPEDRQSHQRFLLASQVPLGRIEESTVSAKLNATLSAQLTATVTATLTATIDFVPVWLTETATVNFIPV